MAAVLDIAVTAWSPLGGGILTGKYKRNAERPKDARYAQGVWHEDLFVTDRNLTIAEEVQAIAAEIGHTPAQVALGWVRQRRGKGVLIPIVGARRLSQLQDNLAVLDLTLDDEQLAHLDAVSAIPLGFPHDFLATDQVLRSSTETPRAGSTTTGNNPQNHLNCKGAKNAQVRV